MFNDFFIAIIRDGLARGYDIFLLGSKAADWYSKGYIDEPTFIYIQSLLVPDGETSPEETTEPDDQQIYE